MVVSPNAANGMRKGKVFVGGLAMNQRSIDGKGKQAGNIVNLMRGGMIRSQASYHDTRS